MGSKKGSSATTLPPPLVECCMCGDRGLSRELFRCKFCQFRYQHKYCSDLYPRAETYRACNWCLREQAEKPLAREDDNSSSPSFSSSTSSDTNNSNGSNNFGAAKLQRRGSFSLHLMNKPIKKQRSRERSSSEMTGRVRAEEISPKTRQVFRAKMKRYKLLEEVST